MLAPQLEIKNDNTVARSSKNGLHRFVEEPEGLPYRGSEPEEVSSFSSGYTRVRRVQAAKG